MGGYSAEFATKGDRNGQREGEVRVAICFYCCFEDKKYFSTFTHWPRRRKTPDASKIRQLQRQCSWEGGRREIDPDPPNQRLPPVVPTRLRAHFHPDAHLFSNSASVPPPSHSFSHSLTQQESKGNGVAAWIFILAVSFCKLYDLEACY